MGSRMLLVEDGHQDGIVNMARDRAMLEVAKSGQATTRVYGWSEQWISLGANQAEIPGITHQVRRPTGGRAVLHGDDITVATAVPLPYGNLGHFQLRPLYSALMSPLQQALTACGLPVRMGNDTEGSVRSKSADCFATTGRFDLCLEGTGTKVGGAALYTCESAALLQVSVLIRNSPAFATFPARVVPDWHARHLARELRSAWQYHGREVFLDDHAAKPHS